VWYSLLRVLYVLCARPFNSNQSLPSQLETASL
jgi:hypothetical protein